LLLGEGAEIYDKRGNLANREIQTVAVDQVLVDKGNHRHFMHKEIHEQPTVLAYALAHYLSPDRTSVKVPEGEPDFTKYDRIVLVACGTAYYACHVAKYWFEQLARIPVEIDVASEFRYRSPPMSGREAAIFVNHCAGKFCRLAHSGRGGNRSGLDQGLYLSTDRFGRAGHSGRSSARAYRCCTGRGAHNGSYQGAKFGL